jgi:homoserine O-succinyltransferase/O-acetyltransferase
MPVHLVGTAASREYESATDCIHIGLINNMPDGALKATDRQFLTLLDSAADGVQVRLSLYALPDVPRTELSQSHVSRFYSSIENLWDSQLDGLIVTGAEPREPSLRDEPYWGNLTKVIEWAEHNTYSTIWSCLAAHAAVLHADGIGRRRLAEKRFGLFECARASDHPLTTRVPSILHVPHSRWNDIPEAELADCGYSVLTRAKDRSVDSFVKQRKSLSVFFQGHPEYETNTLLMEYRRDAGRYLRGERDTYPAMPEGYLDRDTVDLLIALRERALSDRCENLLADFPTALAEGRIATWRPVAARIYENWLAYLHAEKERRLNQRRRWNNLQPTAV